MVQIQAETHKNVAKQTVTKVNGQPTNTDIDLLEEELKDREAKNQFQFYWRAGKTNLADYFTKHHPPAHHHNMRAEF